MTKVVAFVKDHKWYFVGGFVALALLLYFGDSNVAFIAE